MRSNGCNFCDDPHCECGPIPTPTPFFDGLGRRIFPISSGSSFLLLVEAQPGGSGQKVGTSVPPPMPNSSQRPDLQIQSTRALGDGSTAICDTTPPFDGGIPGFDPPGFDTRPGINDALIDFACRFTDVPTSEPCTLSSGGNPATVTAGLPGGSRQFCYIVTTTASFPSGVDTLLTVQVRDEGGNIGPQEQIIIRVAP
jgi:hypothetical protein